MTDLSFKAKLRLRSPETANASWHMISVPDEVCKVVDEYQATLPKKRGWKSVKVKVRIGFYDRETSVFMGKQGYVFPVKKEARKELRVKDGDEVLVNLELL